MLKKSTGIDIGSDFVKVVELSSTGKAISVISFNEYSADGGDVLTLIKQLVKDKKIDFKNICTGIAAENIFFREAFMPFSDRKKISQTIALSLADTLPIDVEEALFSYYIREDADGKTRITSLIARKETVSKLEQLLSEVGLSHNVISVENAATALAISPINISGSYVSLRIDQNKTSIDFVSDKQLVFSRILKFRIEGVLSNICNEVMGKAYEAQQALFFGVNSGGGYDAGNVQKIIDQSLDSLVKEIEVTIKSYNKRHDAVTDLMVFGDGSEIKGLLTLLESKTGFNSAIPDVAGDIHLKSGVNKKDLISKGSVALGYGLAGLERSEINFARDRHLLFGNPIFSHLFSQRKLVIAGAALLLVIYAASLYADLSLEKKKYQELNSQIRKTFSSVLPEVSRIVNESHQLKTALNELEERASIISDEGFVKSIDVLREISANMPEKVVFRATRLRIGIDDVKIEAETNNFDSVEKIKNGLKKSTLFASVDVGGAKASRLQNVIEFQMKVKLVK